MKNHILRSSSATAALLSLAMAAAAVPQKADAQPVAGFSDFGSNMTRAGFGQGHRTLGSDLPRGAVAQSMTSLGSFTRAQELNSAPGRDMAPPASRAGALKALDEAGSQRLNPMTPNWSDTVGGSAFRSMTGHNTPSIADGDGMHTGIEAGRSAVPVFNPVSHGNGRDGDKMSAGKSDEAERSHDVFVPMYHFPRNTFGYDGTIMWPAGPATQPQIRMLGETVPSSTDKADTPADQREEASRPCPTIVTQVKETAPEQPRRRTIEQEQADAWDRGEVWQPPKYNPTGESAFMTGVRQDKANAQADLRRDEQARHDSTMPDGLWDQVYGDPIRHDLDIIRRRDWMIAIYETAYLHGLELGLTNLAAHAYAQIQLDKWREKSLADFEQAFGTHFAQLGQAVSGDPLGNLQKLVAQGVPVIVVKTAATTTKTAALELAEEAGAAKTAGKTVGKTVAKAPPTSGNNATILLANEASASGKSTLAAAAAKAETTPGTYNVFIHSDGTRFGFKLGKQTIIISAKTVKDAMIRTGYKGGTVILNACKAGCMPEGAAQRLADELGETVIAPTSVVSLAGDGTVVTAPGGVWKTFFPTLPATP